MDNEGRLELLNCVIDDCLIEILGSPVKSEKKVLINPVNDGKVDGHNHWNRRHCWEVKERSPEARCDLS